MDSKAEMLFALVAGVVAGIVAGFIAGRLAPDPVPVEAPASVGENRSLGQPPARVEAEAVSPVAGPVPVSA